MTEVIFIESDGTERAVPAIDGVSLMKAALENGVSGIPADCGGACSCATCHVYVDPVWLDRVGRPSGLESSLLELALEVEENSRLSCQIIVTPDLDGLVVRVPEEQG
jgi:2Fe-2S ferredoxin